jgi:putative ATPase
VEDGTLIFIGATTENPSFELNNACCRGRGCMCSRAWTSGMQAGAPRADRRAWPGQAQPELSDDEGFKMLLAAADGDGRRMLNLLENASTWPKTAARSASTCCKACSATRRRFDKGGEAFYDQISRCTNRCAAPTPTARCTGSRA